MIRRLPPVAVALALALLVGSCSGDDPETASAVVDSTLPDAAALTDDGDGDGDIATTTTSDATTTSADADADTETTDAPTTTAPDLPLVDACVTNRRPEVGTQSGTVGSGTNEYDVLWTVPSGYDGGPVPMVVDFHALGSNGGQQNVFSGFGALAEAEGFVAVHPTGLRSDADARISWELPQLDDPERDDLAFVDDLLDFMAAQVCVDQDRIFAAGMSNGAFFTSSLVCAMADRIAGAVSVGGVTHPDSCAPSEPVPYLAFHGTADTVVPYAGGGESTLSEDDGGSPLFSQVIPDEFAEFAADFACESFEDAVVTDDVSHRTWSGCDGDVLLRFYTIDGGGHTWPGSAASAAIESLGPTNTDIDATRLAWDFFRQATGIVDEPE